jgi:enamine deaminase RidA (YjgF/YER057c/UK114 family)
MRVNDMVYAAGLSPADPVTGEVTGDIRAQTAAALTKLKQLVEGAGGSLDNVGRAAGFCTSLPDRQVVDEVWMTVFPDINDKPAFKVLLAELPPGHLVRIDAVALLGERRTRFDIPNVTAHDPTVRIGNWVFSSRCHGNDHATGKIVEGGAEAEARQTLENLATLIRSAGGTEANITQITTFGRDDSYLEPARRAFEQRFPDPARRPALNQVVNFVSPQMQVAMEMVAVL